jgi:hypothetical protein
MCILLVGGLVEMIWVKTLLSVVAGADDGDVFGAVSFLKALSK